MPITIAEKILDVAAKLRRQVSDALSSFGSIIHNLELKDLFPRFATMHLVERLTKYEHEVDVINQEIRRYGLFDSSLQDSADEVDEIVGSLADRFRKWTRRTVITVTDACEKFSRSKSTIYRWIKAGKLIAQKIDHRWVIAD